MFSVCVSISSIKVNCAGLAITIHAAEDETTGNPDNAVVAVRDLHAMVYHYYPPTAVYTLLLLYIQAGRIGHGIQIVKDKEAMEFIKSRKVLLEVSPYSNWITGGVRDLDRHPIRELYQSGVRVCINTDDPGIMDIDINDEYRLLNARFGFTETDFLRFNLWALHASFMPKAAKSRVLSRHFTPLIHSIPSDTDRALFASICQDDMTNESDLS
eukprot:GHVQ01020920.1.p1 GENE.GHVQ01020920.1~~GHVQ01020920.1.p1  ORF type:complete len:213 (+),score=26.77 GHVQ01020920.1:451-1089(+)